MCIRDRQCTLAAGISSASFTVTVTGTSATPVISHNVVVSFSLGTTGTFTLTASPNPVTANPGVAAMSTVTATSQGGFTGTVSLVATPPAGITCSLQSPSVSVPAGGSATDVLTCTGSAAQDYAVVVTGTSGTLPAVQVTVTFHVVDFSISAGAVSPGEILAGAQGASTVTATGINGFTGTVTLSSVASLGLICTLPANVIFGASPQTVTLSCSAASAGDYTVTVTGVSGTLNHSTGPVLFHVVDFAIAATSPAPAPANGTTQATSTISITPLNGFNLPVTLAILVPSGPTCVLSASSITGGSGTAMLLCTSTTAGMFVVQITGTSGTLIHSTSATFNFNDFAISPASPVTVNCSLTAPSTIPLCPQSTPIAASSINGFTGMVTLTVSPSAGLTATLGKGTLDLTTGFDSTTLTLSASAVGSYTVTVTGTNGLLSHTTAIITLVVTTPDFTISASPSSFTIPIGGSGSSTIAITPVNGFSGTVCFSSTVNATGLTVAPFNPPCVTMSGTSNLGVTGNLSGAYLVTVTGTAGTLIHSTPVTVTVSGQNVTAPAFSQTNWKQRLSLSKNNFQQSWTFGIRNMDNATTIFAQVQINAVDGSTGSPFTLTSQTFTLGPNKGITGQTLTKAFTTADIGESFTFQMVILWGTSPTAMTQVSNETTGGIRTSGAFTVLP